MNKHLIVIVGPTAIGKTSTSIALAKQLNCEIISADSRQFYKEMRIGTAVPTPQELAAAPHHCIQHKSITATYTVGDYEQEALTLLNTLFKTNDYIILIGGSGLYIDAVTKGLDHFPTVAPKIRQELQTLLDTKGIAHLQEVLKKEDPDYYTTVDIHNPHRVMRALEICIGSGKPYSSFITATPKKRPFTSIKIGLSADRPIIYDRINRRVDLMIEEGLIPEVTQLQPYKHLNALNTVGYKELFQYLEGNQTLETAIAEIKKNTRRFAKRQLTWFRKDPTIQWFDYQASAEEIHAYITKKTL